MKAFIYYRNHKFRKSAADYKNNELSASNRLEANSNI